MKNLLAKTITLCLLVVLSFSSIKAQTIHAILCGSTNISDIGDGCKVSVQLIENAMKYVGQQTNMEVEVTKCIGNDFSKPKIQAAINKINPSSNDVILFYSTSHGFNYRDLPSKYAMISAHPSKIEMTRKELENFGLSLEHEVYNPLMMKGARLTIAMAEACNTIVDIPAPSNYNAMNVNIQKRLKELFMEAKGAAISTSSNVDQKSWTDPKNGGIYTNMFIEAMNTVMTSSKKATWEEVFAKTDKFTQEYAAKENIRGGQNPISEVNLIDTPVKLVEKEANDTAIIEPYTADENDYFAPKVKVKKEVEEWE